MKATIGLLQTSTPSFPARAKTLIGKARIAGVGVQVTKHTQTEKTDVLAPNTV